jgi:HEAT repeat protein
MTRPGIAVGAVFDPAETLSAYPELIRWTWGAKQMRALGRRGPGIVPKRFKVLLHEEQDRYSWWPSFRTWVERASAGDIVAAYEVCRNPVLRGWLCYRVGERDLHAALPMLVHALNDPVPVVRSEAADALGRIGDPRTGHDLFKRYAIEEDPAVRFWLLFALGATRYAPAVPALIEALADEPPGTWFRDYFAGALANMGDKSALPALRQAYAEEPESDHPSYSRKERIRRAIEELERG